MGYYAKKGGKRHQSPKDYARENFRGIWAASLTPFLAEPAGQASIYGTGGIDFAAWRRNLAHWIDDLHLDGIFVGGKQSEAASLSIAERKELFAIAVEQAAVATRACGIITSCSDGNLAQVLELAAYSQHIGADYVVIHSPVLHFHTDINESVYEYYRYLSEKLEIGIALWNHPDCGYVMSPQLCARIAELPNIVAIKYSVARELYAELTHLAGDKILVSTASEAEWLDNIIDLGWQLYLCSTPPILLQSKCDRRINDYSRLAWAGLHDQARAVRDSLNPAREAFRLSRPPGTPQAHSKYWQEKLGQAGGKVRRPLLNLTAPECAVIDARFAASGININPESRT
ncbi:MAG: dihydrodipicolinate synthase family protein [Candidatus Symbiobacter sp.]|nr:dihydrodipicolinate synthase family protein [Candidatus Symbiobacter sp.]